MSTYSPFDKPINSLLVSDLATLKSIREGWYIEYKSQWVSARSVAKSLSAFANTYGGWLFFGIEENQKEDPTAGSFPGISDNELQLISQRLRQSVAEYLTPIPYYETICLHGPCDAIGLRDGVSVIVIEVPQSNTAPHIHKDGRIYRRAADSAEPKPETDRFLLDQLWQRADTVRDEVREWIQQDPEFSKAEAEVPYLRLLLSVDPWRQRVPYLDATLNTVRKILASLESNNITVAFDTVYPSSNGFIARQNADNDPWNYTLTWRIRRDLSCDLLVPLPLYSTSSLDELIVHLDGYENADLFIDVLREKGHISSKIVDMNVLMNVLIAAVAKYRRLLRLTNGETSFYYKSRLLNVWRAVPFIDLRTVLEEFRQYGTPMILDEIVTMPDGTTPDSFAHSTAGKLEGVQEHREVVACQLQAFVMFSLISYSFGVSCIDWNAKGESEEDVIRIPSDQLVAVGDRAMRAQKRRRSRRISDE